MEENNEDVGVSEHDNVGNLFEIEKKDKEKDAKVSNADASANNSPKSKQTNITKKESKIAPNDNNTTKPENITKDTEVKKEEPKPSIPDSYKFEKPKPKV